MLNKKRKGVIMDKYKNEYLNLINDDEDFADIWQDSDEDFAEWCQIHDIKINKGGNNE
jgi:chloramphenicol O-acetyltransferase